jgi:formate dehydrogenase assembly factor FdhD
MRSGVAGDVHPRGAHGHAWHGKPHERRALLSQACHDVGRHMPLDDIAFHQGDMASLHSHRDLLVMRHSRAAVEMGQVCFFHAESIFCQRRDPRTTAGAGG